MKNKVGFGLYFLATVFVFFALPIQESQLTIEQQANLLHGFNGDDIYLLMSSALFFWFDYLALMMPLQGLLEMRLFLQLRPVSLGRRIVLYFSAFYPYLIAVVIVKGLSVLDGTMLSVVKVTIFILVWWGLLLTLSMGKLSRSYATGIAVVVFVLLRLLYSVL